MVWSKRDVQACGGRQLVGREVASAATEARFSRHNPRCGRGLRLGWLGLAADASSVLEKSGGRTLQQQQKNSTEVGGRTGRN